MHFISMLAVQLPIPLSYAATPTSISALIAVIGTAVALAIVSSRRFGDATLPLSALFLGLGIGGMHYLGMYGIRGSCVIQYSWLGVAISVLIAIQASAVALWFAFRQRGVIDTFLGAIALGLAIALMHYSGMEATHFRPGAATYGDLALLWSEKYLAFAITVTIYAVCGTCLIVFAILVFRPRRAPAKLLPQFNALSEHLRRDRIESRQVDHPDLPEQFESDWSIPVSDLAFIERRLDGFDQNRREPAFELDNSRKSTSTRH
jgi:NO-binding membrane sensor protein with MHYT domain